MKCLACIALLPTSIAGAQTPGGGGSGRAPALTAGERPSPQRPPSAPEEEEIVIRAPAEQRTAIDRETYVVSDTAQARTSNALDILGRIPAITVQPDNSIRLLGTAGVTVLVDGRPSPNPNILRDLQGGEIARIEVVSNPSAQYSASGTGGIVNIITRGNALNGFRGSVTASVSRYDGHEIRAAPNWTSGKWTISGNAGWTRNGSVTESTRERISLDAASPVQDSLETMETRGRFGFVNGSGQIAYRPSEKKTITFQSGLIRAEGENVTESELVTSSPPVSRRDQVTTSQFDYQAYNASIEYRSEGERPGQLLTTSVQQYRFDPTSDVLTDFGNGDFRFRSDAFTRARTFKLDYVHPLENGRRILTGGSATDTHEFNRVEQSGGLLISSNPFPPVATIDGSVVELAIYGSYQFPLLGGTLLGGLRIEGRDYDFAEESLGEGPSEAQFFPSAHFERRIAPWLTATVSYSRRISWPAVQQLSPAPRFADSTTATIGNPALRPESTDAFEARFRAEVKRQTISLTLFSRHTDNLFSTLFTLTDEGVLINQPVNIGERSDLGASLAGQGRIIRGLTYNLNFNLIDRRIERERFGLFRATQSANYSATAQIDYRDGADGRQGADRFTLTANYSGPYDDGLVRRSSFFRASASWSHAITDRLSGVLTVDDVFGPTGFRTSTVSDTALTRSAFFSDGPRVKAALTYSFGRPGQPQPQPQSPAGPSLPIPGQ